MDLREVGWDGADGSCGHGNEPPGSVRGGEFLDQLIDSNLLKNSAP